MALSFCCRENYKRYYERNMIRERYAIDYINRLGSIPRGMILFYFYPNSKGERNMNNLLVYSKRFMKRNASTILTGIGAAGVVATTVMAVKATPKALKLLDAAKEEKGEELTKLEVVKTAGPAYIPAILVGTSTIACIFGANILNKRHQAALMSAYALVDNSYKEYKKKVEELYGEEVDGQVRSEMAKDNYDEKEVIDDESDGKQLFYDEFSERYFRSTMEAVLNAEYELNKEVTIGGAAFLNEFYEFLGIPRVDYGDYLGWSSPALHDMYWEAWIDFAHEKVVMEDGLECTIIRMTEPFPEFEEY